jgi:hypothetical protein
MINAFTYYEHLEEANKHLLHCRFIDGETYVIGKINGRPPIQGNFLINIIRDSVYIDIPVNQTLLLDPTPLKKILKIIEPIAFKNIK